MRFKLITLSLCLMFAGSAIATEQYQKWQDEKGVWHYGKKAPANAKAEAIKLSSNTPEVTTVEDPQGEALGAATAAKEREEACVRVRSNLSTLQTFAQVKKDMNGDGEAEILTEAQKQVEIGRSQEMMKALCDEAQPL